MCVCVRVVLAGVVSCGLGVVNAGAQLVTLSGSALVAANNGSDRIDVEYPFEATHESGENPMGIGHAQAAYAFGDDAGAAHMDFDVMLATRSSQAARAQAVGQMLFFTTLGEPVLDITGVWNASQGGGGIEARGTYSIRVSDGGTHEVLFEHTIIRTSPHAPLVAEIGVPTGLPFETLIGSPSLELRTGRYYRVEYSFVHERGMTALFDGTMDLTVRTIPAPALSGMMVVGAVSVGRRRRR